MANSQTKQPFAVYWRARDGQGTHTWKLGMTEAEATAQIRWCESTHPEATLVWIIQDGAARARTIHHPGVANKPK